VLLPRIKLIRSCYFRHPIHISTTDWEPHTKGIHNNTLPVTHIPIARTQAVATKDLVTDRFTTITDFNRVLLSSPGSGKPLV
jgi:hypothetical protein